MAPTVMNMPNHLQVIMLVVIAICILALLTTALRRAGRFGALLLACGGSVVVLLVGAHFLGSSSTRSKPAIGRKPGKAATRVWVDTHTGIYYCPGTELYGRTNGGQYMMQRSAQGDLFSPAYNQPCQ